MDGGPHRYKHGWIPLAGTTRQNQRDQSASALRESILTPSKPPGSNRDMTEIKPSDIRVSVDYLDSTKKVQIISLSGSRVGTVQKTSKGWVATSKTGESQTFQYKSPSMGWLLNR